MRLGGLVLIFMLGATALGADGPAGGQNLRPQPTRLEEPPIMPFGDGAVLDVHGRPVAGAEVLAFWTYWPDTGMDSTPHYLLRTNTNAAGLFSIVPPPELAVQKVDVQVRDGQGNIGWANSFNHSMPRRMMQIQLQSERYYQVQVVDQDGQPCSGVRIHGDTILAPRITSTTDLRGFARVLATKTGLRTNSLLAHAPGKGVAYVKRPGWPATDRKSSKILRVTLVPTRSRQIEVVDSERQPLKDATVDVNYFYLERQLTYLNHSYSQQTNAQGLASVDLPNASGSVTVSKEGYATQQRMLRSTTADVKEPVTRVVLPELVTVEGMTQDETLDEDATLTLQVLGTCKWEPDLRRRIVLDEPGPFKIRLPADSRAVLWLSRGTHRSELVPLALSRGQEPEPVKLGLHPKIPVKGKLLASSDGQPLAGRKVKVYAYRAPRQVFDAAFPAEENRRQIRITFETLRCEGGSVITEEDGSFEFAADPGFYQFKEESHGEAISLTIEPGDTPEITVWGTRLRAGK